MYNNNNNKQKQPQQDPDGDIPPPSSSTTTTTTIRSSGRTNDSRFIACSYKRCRDRMWFPGFMSMEEYRMHMQLHRCQWFSIEKGKPCEFTPQNEDEMMRHVEEHLKNDKLPSGKTTDGCRTVYFCPWQTCSSLSYANRGAINKAHISEHIRTHP